MKTSYDLTEVKIGDVFQWVEKDGYHWKNGNLYSVTEVYKWGGVRMTTGSEFYDVYTPLSFDCWSKND